MGDSFDQSMIDKIVATAESDTIESKVASLEEEVNEIKGSIKNLLMDIRETMSVLENPFQNIQGIANISSAIVSPKPAEEIPEERPPKKEEVKEDEPEEEDLEVEKVPKNFLEDLKKAAKRQQKRGDSKLIDPISFYKTIVWCKDMAGKYNQDAIKELLEVFTLLGYIPGEIKEIIVKILDILFKNNNLDDAVVDLYRLYHILYPEDLSLDSKMLDHILNEKAKSHPE
ncbi:hypothetical protein [Methanosarcina sp.]|jgi:hypothetical protein|uniref:hypothetical protein n=1 Tax=Methanosarcina sp. TaxID=2213 RepID=UPI002BEEFD79|nr:hypothetical protein [Methanosarcina sp.]HOW13261.1 hypothetical protein [Methanosarcina sp.]